MTTVNVNSGIAVTCYNNINHVNEQEMSQLKLQKPSTVKQVASVAKQIMILLRTLV